MKRIKGYDCYPEFGWRSYGRLIVNFARGVVTSVYFGSEVIWLSPREL